MNDQKPTFKEAMEASMIWCKSWENDEISDEVISDRIGELIKTVEGARGFFVEGFSSFASLESESLQVSLGMTIGTKRINTQGLSFELFAGLSRYITGTNNEFHFPLGIAVGKRF